MASRSIYWLIAACVLFLFTGCATDVVLRQPTTGRTVICPGEYAPGGIPTVARSSLDPRTGQREQAHEHLTTDVSRDGHMRASRCSRVTTTKGVYPAEVTPRERSAFRTAH